MQKYVVGFTVYDARNLTTEDGEPCSPFVRAECCGKKWDTQIKTDQAQYVPWNENHIWPDVQLYPDEFESAYIEFSVYARNWFTRNYLIGKVSIQLESINKRSFHVYAKKSLNLRLEGCSGYTGLLNLTVFCLKQGEAAPSESQQQGAGESEETKEKTNDTEDITQCVLGTAEPPSGKVYDVGINIFRVEDLAQVSSITGCCDPSPFVTVEFAGACLSTTQANSVQQYTWNECATIPVQTPVYEDTILIKLWHHGDLLRPDELLAQGLVSFSELRNNALPPRWYTFYGWNPDEIGDIKTLSKGGESIKPNYFKGSLLISGRVEPAKSDNIEAAHVGAAKSCEEPLKVPKALLADVYEVNGAVGRECRVELSFGKFSKGTKEWVTPNTEDKSAASQAASSRKKEEEEDEDKDREDREDVTTFSFTQAQGRIDPMLVMTPEEVESQPYVMLNVYTRGVLSGASRIGYQMKRIKDFPKYELGNPSKPRYLALEPMSFNSQQRLPGSVLVVIDQSPTDDVVRHNRKNVKPMQYIVRAYIFMARNITTDSMKNYAVRVSCAGVSKSTAELREVRPMWMKALDLKVTLSSDHPKEPPTMEPITITLCDQSTTIVGKSQTDLGKAVCQYEYMRQLDNMGNWEPFRLRPQWIKLFGGSYGGKDCAEVLLAFELLQWKCRSNPELVAKPMWPVSESEFDNRKHFARLRKAKLHFALHGLRDVNPAGIDEKNAPTVVVQIKKFKQDVTEKDKYHEIRFNYSELVQNGDREVREDHLHTWRTDALGKKNCLNYEFFKAHEVAVEIPYSNVLQPFIAIKVIQPPSLLGSYFGSGEGTLIGEHRADLTEHFPCCWYEGVDLKKPFEQQKALIEKRLQEAKNESEAHAKYEEESSDARDNQMKEEREKRLAARKKEAKTCIEMQEEEEDAVNSAALPSELRPFHDKTNTKGYTERVKVELNQGLHRLNMKTVKSFADREGEKKSKNADDVNAHSVASKLEDSTDPQRFLPDFAFRSKPLLQNHDLVRSSDTTDWHFRHGLHSSSSQCFGFVRCVWKLVDDEERCENCKKIIITDANLTKCCANPKRPPATNLALSDGTPDPAVPTAIEQLTEVCDEDKLRQSFGIPDLLNNIIFNERKFTKHFKGKENVPTQLYSYVPSRIRVRIYFVRAICIFGKGTGTSFSDPFLSLDLGQDINVSMRNMFQVDTNTPAFYRVEERDIELPAQSRLKIDLCDYSHYGASFDQLIGSTVIDLEDRWHSRAWKAAREKGPGKIPRENRPLFNPAQPAGHTSGSIEMWVEMLNSERASEEKVTELLKPKPIELEMRLVIWTTRDIKIVDGNHTDVKVVVALDCNAYEGEHPKTQSTDTHLGSKDGNAIFAWRVVYPKINMSFLKSCCISVKVYDANSVASDSFIGSVDIDLRRYCEKVAHEMDAITNEADLKIRPSSVDPGEEPEDIGSVQFQLQVMTQAEATQKLAGIGRDEPNDYPQLVTPTEGRGWGDVFSGFEFALPDMGLMKKVIPLIVFTLLCLVVLRWAKLI
jgi:hypothetical protein